ncbi:MAG: branched-chain amino acid ABC transporter permease LivH [Desulfovibrio sp.]|nr:MAG: branched-chain amino acid ABC transporter permease LivH [Desulfovibrio sp.]
MKYFSKLFLSGITKGSIYALIALGYTMVYGIIELINFAHGEIYMLGAYIGFLVAVVLTLLGFPGLAILAIATVVAIIYCASYGYTIEKVAYKPLRGAPRLSPLISAIGMSIFLQNYVLMAQTSDFRRFPDLIPDFGFLENVSSYLQSTDLVIIISSLLVMIGLTMFIQYTRMGKAMRATAQNRKMAMLVGINADKVISMTFLIGSGLAAVGGILIACDVSQINHYIGFIAGLKAFTAAVLGGIGSVPGAMIGGLILGCTESLGTGYIASDYEDVFAFSLLVLILIFRPSGILGKHHLQKV